MDAKIFTTLSLGHDKRQVTNELWKENEVFYWEMQESNMNYN